MLILGGVEQLAQDAVVQVDDFVGNSSHALDGQRHEGGVTSLWLELGQVGGRHLATLAGDLEQPVLMNQPLDAGRQVERLPGFETRSEEHTSELQSLMRISYAVFCLKKKNTNIQDLHTTK